MTKQLIQNAIQTPDGTILNSVNRHDYSNYLDANKELYFVDGGLEYIRKSQNKIEAISLELYDNEKFDILRTKFIWGTYGKTGKDEFKWIKLSEMTNEHIQAIIDTQKNIGTLRLNIFKNEIIFTK